MTSPKQADELLEQVARAICRVSSYCDLDKPDGQLHWRKNKEMCLLEAKAAIDVMNARLSSPSVPEGYVIVPRDATEDMLHAASCVNRAFYGPYSLYLADSYRAMIVAAPQPPSAPPGRERVEKRKR